MLLKLIEQAKCLPVSLEEARKQVRVDSSNSSVNTLIMALTRAASDSSSSYTGRVWVEEKWQWEPDDIELFVGGEIPLEFPICPVTSIAVYDLDEVITVGGEYTDISSTVVSVKYPSLEPKGSPLFGSLLPLSGFPTNFQIVLTVGYPVTETTTAVEQVDSPTLVVDSTRYSTTKIVLVFNRPVQGAVVPSNFTVKQDGLDIVPESVAFNAGRVELTFAADTLVANSAITVSFIEGSIYDAFDNYVEPITNVDLPVVAFVEETSFVTPAPVPTTTTYTSTTPEAVKTAILMQLAFLYTQGTGSALKTGASVDKNYTDQVAKSLLAPYRVSF